LTSCRKQGGAIAAGLAAVAVAVWTAGARAELPEWVRNVDAGGRFHDAFFRTVPMPAGPVEVRRAPADTYEALTKLQGAVDRDARAMRARAAEEALDPVAAETEWKAYAAASADVADGQLALADFYHRRLMPQQEADALARAAPVPDPPADRLLPAAERRSWRTFERLFSLIAAQQLPDALAEAQYRAWIARFPDEAPPYDRLFRFLVAHDRPADAEALVARYQQSLPSDEGWPLKARAELATRRGATADALAVYDRTFRPLWDADLVQAYFELLERTHTMRAFLEKARADIAARPADVTPVARLFYYYYRAGNVAAAEQALADFEARRENATRPADELFTLAKLYEKTRNGNEAVRYYCAIYGLPAASAADTERALASIIETLFAAPEQPLRLGSGDLSFYRDIATLDRYPGFLNGALSLLFNSASPREQYAREESAAVSYFHRGRAADLLALFETRFPTSPRRAGLQSTLVTTYAAYGESDAVIDRGRRFLATFPTASERPAVMLAMADAFARKEQSTEELAIYDRLLQELAARADRVPLGASVVPPEDARVARGRGARSQEYARVLDRYISRLVSRKQLPEALAVYRREIDRNPADPGLYAAAAQFLDQNDFTAEVAQVYRLAIQQFPDRSWHHRLARWYLRRRQAAAFEELTRDAVRSFDGTELASYFTAIVNPGADVNARLYLQLNLYAHERFPHHLTFVRNLLTAYATPETRNQAASDALLRRHWFEDDNLAALFFATLSAGNRLDGEIAEVRRINATGDGNWGALARNNAVAARFLAEAEIWRSQFETATPVLTALATEHPSDVELGHRVGSLHRSLSYFDPREADAAARTEEQLLKYDPRNVATRTVLGEIYADRERYDRARTYWDPLPDVEPGTASGYLEAATVFWDYYQFEDALRVIARGRAKLGNPALFAYEAGAIDEGLRQPERAVEEYVRGALAAEGESPARTRLLTLAKRQAYRPLIDRASVTATDQQTPPSAAISLRIAVLEAQDRRPDLERFLSALVDRTSSFELMGEIGSHADRLGFQAVRTQSLVKQIDVMTDPIDKLQLRYALVRLHESRGDLDRARMIVEAVYAGNPTILGIVRQTVDYYWRHDLRREAITALTRAAAASYPALKTKFTFEAARKATDIGEYAEARALLKPLLDEDPFNADDLAAVADTYALAKDDGALRDFYTSTIEAMRGASMPADERTRRIAGLRRALIPALTRLNDYTGAVDQYIEIINRFPDDDGLLREGGRYARQHGRAAQLVAYYAKTATESPRDYRWPMLLAKLQTEFEDFPAAIAAYATAIAIRPDRADFHTARAALEERLMRFDEAVGSYTKAYDLTYRAPEWMEKIATLRARQGQVDAAAKALRTALVDGRPERPDTFFAVASRLEEWRMLEAARPFADEGARLAGPDGLLERPSPYVSIYTRLRQAPATFDRLLAARDRARAAQRPGADQGRFSSALALRLQEMGEVVARDFAPEEKTAFAAFLEQKKAAMDAGDFQILLVPLADRAGLMELAVRWRAELMTGDRLSQSNEHLGRLVQLQTDRLRFADLAKQLETFADLGGRHVIEARNASAEAYRKASDPAGELRVLSRASLIDLPPPLLTRYFELLLERDPPRLITLAGAGQPRIRDAVANHVVAHATIDQALAVIQARGRGLPPVWTKAYTALVSLHFGRFDATTTGVFTSLLGTGTVGEGLAPVDRATGLAGDTWFAYASRYGEYLSFAGLPDPESYLPAAIEGLPARSDAYVVLADFFRDRNSGARALNEYDHAATLNGRRSDVHFRAAAILWRQGRRAAAIERYTRALQLLAAQAARGSVDAAPLAAALDTIGTRKLWPELREPADKMLRAYIARNGTYRAGGLFRAAFRAAGSPVSGTDWLVDLARDAPNQIEMLGAVASAPWLPDTQRDRIYERIVSAAEESVTQQYGAAQAAAQASLDRWRVGRIRSLVDTRQVMHGGELLRALPESARSTYRGDVIVLETRVAAAKGTLETALARYAREENPSVRQTTRAALRNAATALRRSGDRASARRIMELVYTEQLEEQLEAPTILGLAEIRLEQGNVPAALDLVHRLTLAVGEPFENLSASAALLERLQHPAEALELRRARAQAVPWDQAAQIALARAELAAAADRTGALDRLARLAETPTARYALRVEAAEAFASAGGRIGRRAESEIDLLRAPMDLTPAAVDRPMFVAGRLAAARRVTEPSTRVGLLLAAVAADPQHAGLRVPLFRAQLATGKTADAIESLAPRLRRDRSLANLGLTGADRTRLARELGDAYQRVDQLPEAVRFFTLAVELENAAARPALRQRIASIESEIGRRARNASRRPQVGESLDQPQLVRPQVPPVIGVTAVSQGAR
jgi:Flp pilus assembly protein TadD